MSSQNSPRISQCSTANSEGLRSSNASTLSAVATAEPSASSSSAADSKSAAPESSSSSASTFSVIGRTLTKFIHGTFKPSKKPPKKDSSRKLIQKHLIRRKVLPPSASQCPSSGSVSTYSSSSTINGGRRIQKWVFTCKGCSRPINFNDVKADNAIYALDGVWHRSHLVCFKCMVPIGDECRPFIASGVDGKKALCLDCDMEAEHSTCSFCRLPLFESCVEIDEKRIHQSCFVCERCKAPFEGGKYALINEKPYDLDCYYFKAYEAAFAPQPSNSFLDLTQSPPPLATNNSSDSSTTSPTTSMIEDQTYFKKKTTEMVSLCDVGHPLPPPEKRKELSTEVFETDHIKFPLPPPPPPSDDAPPRSSPSLDALLLSNEKIVPPQAVKENAVPKVISKEKLEDFDNGLEIKKEEEQRKKELAELKMKKAAKDQKKLQQNQSNSPTVPPPASEPHSYAEAAAAATTTSKLGDSASGATEKSDETKKDVEDQKKKDENPSATVTQIPNAALKIEDVPGAAPKVVDSSIIPLMNAGIDEKEGEKKEEKSNIAIPPVSPAPHSYAEAAAAASKPGDTIVPLEGTEEKKTDNEKPTLAETILPSTTDPSTSATLSKPSNSTADGTSDRKIASVNSENVEEGMKKEKDFVIKKD